jgi:hypothetical protein
MLRVTAPLKTRHSRRLAQTGGISPVADIRSSRQSRQAMNPLRSFNRVAADLVGMKVSSLWRGYGSAIFVEFGALSPGRVRRDGSPGNPIGELAVGIEWSWRIEDAMSIICGSWSEEELWEPAFELVRGSRVTGLTLFGRLPEIDLALTDDRHLLSFATAEGQPEWSFADRRSSPHIWLSVRDGLLFESDGTGVQPQ